MSTLSAQSVSLHHDGVLHQTSLRSRWTMMTRANSLHVREPGRPNQCFGHSRTRTSANTGIPARTPRLRLPRQATTAELRVIDPIAQHDPEPNPQLPRRRDAGLRESLLRDLPSIEPLEVRIPPHGMRGRLAPEKPQERIPLFAEGAEPLPLPARVLPRDHADVARECLPVWKSGGVTHKDVRRQRSNGSDARMGHQQRGSRT